MSFYTFVLYTSQEQAAFPAYVFCEENGSVHCNTEGEDVPTTWPQLATLRLSRTFLSSPLLWHLSFLLWLVAICSSNSQETWPIKFTTTFAILNFPKCLKNDSCVIQVVAGVLFVASAGSSGACAWPSQWFRSVTSRSEAFYSSLLKAFTVQAISWQSKAFQKHHLMRSPEAISYLTAVHRKKKNTPYTLCRLISPNFR